MKLKHNLTTGQCKPIFSGYNIYRHYLTLTAWERAAQLPLLSLFFERALYAHQLTAELGCGFVHPELMIWATSNAGVQSSKKSYQTLETYGDTVLKLAGTLLSWRYCEQFEKNVDENKIDQLKIAFITNLYFLRVGKRLGLNRYIRTIDPDLKTWSPPFSEQVAAIESINCTGKNIADVVESVIGAHFMSNNLRRSLELISDMRIMPLRQAGVIDMFPDADLTFELAADLDSYNFSMDDAVEDIFAKYFIVHHHIKPEVRQRICTLIDKNRPTGTLGEAYSGFIIEETQHLLRDMG